MTGRTAISTGPRFVLPEGSDATAPPERRGVDRDGVRLLVAGRAGIEHTVFRRLADHLHPGDLLVVNTSATLPAAVDGVRTNGVRGPVHVATGLDDGSWVVEFRRTDNSGAQTDLSVGEVVGLSGGLDVRIGSAFPDEQAASARLWRVTPSPAQDRLLYLREHGRPVHYGYLNRAWPLSDLQNVYARQPGSAEMPSAGRPLSRELLVELMSTGVVVAPVVLHAGLSSPDKHEPPAAEPFEVPAATACLVNTTRDAGGRVVAVGTTSVRALESVAETTGRVTAGSGWTDLLLSPARPARVCTGLVSGLHEPEASHLLLLEAVAGPELVATAYREAVAERYLWHEFGDSMLLLP